MIELPSERKQLFIELLTFFLEDRKDYNLILSDFLIDLSSDHPDSLGWSKAVRNNSTTCILEIIKQLFPSGRKLVKEYRKDTKVIVAKIAFHPFRKNYKRTALFSKPNLLKLLSKCIHNSVIIDDILITIPEGYVQIKDGQVLSDDRYLDNSVFGQPERVIEWISVEVSKIKFEDARNYTLLIRQINLSEY